MLDSRPNPELQHQWLMGAAKHVWTLVQQIAGIISIHSFVTPIHLRCQISNLTARIFPFPTLTASDLIVEHSSGPFILLSSVQGHRSPFVCDGGFPWWLLPWQRR